MVSFVELIPEARTDDSERRLIISDVTWDSYELILAKLEDNSHYRVTYLDETLEIVSPSKKHENVKSRIGFLIEFYFCKKRIKHFSMGSTTRQKSLKTSWSGTGRMLLF